MLDTGNDSAAPDPAVPAVCCLPAFVGHLVSTQVNVRVDEHVGDLGEESLEEAVRRLEDRVDGPVVGGGALHLVIAGRQQVVLTHAPRERMAYKQAASDVVLAY